MGDNNPTDYSCPNEDCDSNEFEQNKIVNEQIKITSGGDVSTVTTLDYDILSVTCAECGTILL